MKIKVLSSKKTITNEKGKETTFYRYFTPVRIHVIDLDGNDIGEQEKSLSVHFTKVASKKLKDEKVFSIFECKSEDVGFPYTYKMLPPDATDEERSKNDVWIRDFDNENPIPYTPKQSTCVFLTDEEQSEPIEIID